MRLNQSTRAIGASPCYLINKAASFAAQSEISPAFVVSSSGLESRPSRLIYAPNAPPPKLLPVLAVKPNSQKPRHNYFPSIANSLASKYSLVLAPQSAFRREQSAALEAPRPLASRLL